MTDEQLDERFDIVRARHSERTQHLNKALSESYRMDEEERHTILMQQVIHQLAHANDLLLSLCGEMAELRRRSGGGQ